MTLRKITKFTYFQFLRNKWGEDGLRKIDTSYYGQNESFHSKKFQVFSEVEIEIMFQASTIRRYIENLRKLQLLEDYEYHPLTESRVKNFFSHINSNFNYKNIKYNQSSDIDLISRIISYVGKSGYNYIKSANTVIPLNRPVLLFYGIEQLSTFFSYLHFNFTQENNRLSPIRNKFRTHGIDPWEFNNIDSSSSIDDLLNYKIKLLKEGAVQRFFFVLGFPVKEYFFKELKYSLLDLIQIFFTKLGIGLSNKLISKFSDDFSIKKPIEIKYQEDLDLLIFYSLSFLFSHLSRYKIFTWQKLLQTEERNLGFFIKYIIKRINDLFIREIFSILEHEREQLWILLRHPKKGY